MPKIILQSILLALLFSTSIMYSSVDKQWFRREFEMRLRSLNRDPHDQNNQEAINNLLKNTTLESLGFKDTDELQNYINRRISASSRPNLRISPLAMTNHLAGNEFYQWFLAVKCSNNSQ